MRSAKSYFNSTIFFRNLKRYWPIWSLYIFALGITVVVTLLPLYTRSGYGSNHANTRYIYVAMRETLPHIGAVAGAIINLIFGAISALAVFSFLYDYKQTQMIHNLPTRREGHFFTAFASGLTWLIGANLIAFLLAFLLQLFAGYCEFAALLTFFTALCANSICFFGIAALCALFVGNKWGMLLLYAVLNFGALLIEAIVRWVLSLFVFGLSATGIGFSVLLTPVALMPIASSNAYIEDVYTLARFIPWILVCAALGLILAAVALLLYRRRQLESASELIAVKPLRPIFRYTMAFLVSGLLCGLLLELVFGYETGGRLCPSCSVCS
ncbi:MAG: hypothetical protein FWF10_06515 [Clostridiales bacterium]|nr:hypothetical protein [Clostridiales bacterium]